MKNLYNIDFNEHTLLLTVTAMLEEYRFRNPIKKNALMLM
jgi:hypothetical protein